MYLNTIIPPEYKYLFNITTDITSLYKPSMYLNTPITTTIFIPLISIITIYTKRRSGVTIHTFLHANKLFDEISV